MPRSADAGIDPAAVGSSYDRVAEEYADAVGGELDRRPLERAVLAAVLELAGLDAEPGVLVDLGAGPGTWPATSAISAWPSSPSTSPRPWRPSPSAAPASRRSPGR